MSEQYVRHISGIGGRWLLNALTGYNRDQTHSDWCVHREKYGTLFLPKSEYQFCEPPPPPERWEDVTSECECRSHGDFSDGLYHQGKAVRAREYRLRKVECTVGFRPERRCCFIVEKKVQP